MLTATVIGSVWATRRLAELPNGAFLEVEAEGTGQRLIAFGAAGRIYLSGPSADVRRAQNEITEVLSAVAGRDHLAGPYHPTGPHHLVGREP